MSWTKKTVSSTNWNNIAKLSSSWTKKTVNINFGMTNVNFGMVGIGWNEQTLWQEHI